jgi:predicted enzyme related to lactoylglutathione lyase
MCARVTGIGGIFFKCKDPQKLREWYHQHLGIKIEEYGATFNWMGQNGHTVWGTFKQDTKYFEPSQQQFMINFRVDDLESLLKQLKHDGVEQVGEMHVYEYGKFAHIIDIEGNKIELWEPNDDEYGKMIGQNTNP